MAGFHEAEDTQARSARRDGQAPESPLPPILTVVPTGDGEHAVLALKGDIDLSTVSEVGAAAARCLQEHPRRLSIDLSGLAFCDASGVRLLRSVLDDAVAAGTQCRLVAPSDWIRRVFALANAEDMLAAVDEMEQARDA